MQEDSRASDVQVGSGEPLPLGLSVTCDGFNFAVFSRHASSIGLLLFDHGEGNLIRTIELDPDSVTIYQMELPFNTVYSKDILGGVIETPVADWPAKRAWVDYAFDQLGAAGYSVSSAYTMVKNPQRVNFSYRDNLWQGSDLLATGIASFGHVSAVHYQNHAEWEQYCRSLEAGELPLMRGMRLSQHQRLVRETILQIKRGYLDGCYFRKEFETNIIDQWRAAWDEYEEEGLCTIDRQAERVELTREGLLQVDALLPAFFEPQFRGVRYT
jgi:oxygen-independent coproporphyrinogen III oxidase